MNWSQGQQIGWICVCGFLIALVGSAFIYPGELLHGVLRNLLGTTLFISWGVIYRLDNSGDLAWLGVVLHLIGALLFVWGCSIYISAKRHHPAWGLVGLSPLFGLLILAALSDKTKEAK